MKNKFSVKTFGENVFDYDKMKKYLPRSTYEAIVAARELGIPPKQKHIDAYAKALQKWAISRSATRYTHFFQPLNDLTAEKRDSMLSLNKEGNAKIKFGGKQLQFGEGDASSLPNGGLRKTFAARGVTNWDYTAFAFILGDCLHIPTTFCGANGQTLDKKSPLIRSGYALNKQALRLLEAINMPAKSVKSVVGAEQEYFLIDKTLFDKRKDLVYTGRTLFGQMPPKGQEFADHYFRPPCDKVIRFMQEVDEELWKLGIIVKTEHNEVAPRQYELVPCYTEVNVACDHNQLVKETLLSVATRQGSACLLHEKPFDKINGSGKHNNWSLKTDDDINLLETGETPNQHARFLLIISAIIKAVDEYNGLLASSAASASNDLRLGGFEAPPQILTVFLGEPLTNALKDFANGKLRLGKDLLPKNIFDTDRNRTSPFAFGSNKFEFRTVGSSANIADVNTVMNAIAAESFRIFADELEQSDNKNDTAKKLIADVIDKNSRVIYNGDCYSEKWITEATQRGLIQKQTAEAVNTLAEKKTVELFERHGILKKYELQALKEIKLRRYCDTVNLECVVSCEIYQRQICPASEDYVASLCSVACDKQKLNVNCDYETDKIKLVTDLIAECQKAVGNLQNVIKKGQDMAIDGKAVLYGGDARRYMSELRNSVNKLEQICPKSKWPLPTYGQLLFDEK